MIIFNILTITIIWILGAFTMTQVYGELSNRGIDWIKICEKAPDFLLPTSCDELVAPLAGTLSEIWTNSPNYW